MGKSKTFVNPNELFRTSKIKTAPRPKSPSPKRADYHKRARLTGDKVEKCTYLHPDTGKRCKNALGLYPKFCELHTMMIENVYISKSNIPVAGNGLFAGPYGFKKGDIVGQYSHPWNEVKMKTLLKRCKKDDCWSYVFCEGDENNELCWDGLDIRSTIMRNINDAHNSGFRNNAVFDVIKGQVYVIATKNIKPNKEIFVNYGPSYWQK